MVENEDIQDPPIMVEEMNEIPKRKRGRPRKNPI